jgi:hypothetical protein
VTTDTFNALKKQFRNGSITRSDFDKLVEELVIRDERWNACLIDLRQRFDEMRDAFILMLTEEE